MKMFNRVKFVINKILSQNSKNKKNFIKIKKCNKYDFSISSSRKFSSLSNGQQQPPDPFNKLFLLAAIFCGSLFFIKKNKN